MVVSVALIYCILIRFFCHQIDQIVGEVTSVRFEPRNWLRGDELLFSHR
jgi:hypothetical protein